MANHVGTKLSRLIKERAYLTGSLPELDGQIAELKLQIRKSKAMAKEARQRIEQVDWQIQALSAIDTTQIRAIRRTPRRLQAKHGAFVGELIQILREDPLPVRTEDIVAHMVQVFNMPQSTPHEREHTRKRITRCLRNLVSKGAVKRLHDPRQTISGLWCWTGSYGEPDTEA